MTRKEGQLSVAPTSIMIKSLDAKLAEIKANPAAKTFVLADAKDADMAFGVQALSLIHI